MPLVTKNTRSAPKARAAFSCATLMFPVGSRRLSSPPVVAESGLAEKGWVAVDPDTLLTPFPDVYAVGDCVAIPMAKAGVFAENAAGVAADGIIARLRGEELGRRYEGEGNCYLEFGSGRVAKVEANFLGGPSPRASVVGPSEDLAAEKAEFARSRRKRWFGLT